MNTLLDTAEPWLHAITTLSWKGALLTLAVGLVMLLLRRHLSPAWRHGLWLLVLLRFVVPDLGTSSLSMNRIPQVPATLSSQTLDLPEFMPTPQPMELAMSQIETALPVMAAPVQARPLTTPIPEPWTLWQKLTLVWLLGVVVVFAAMLALHLRLLWRLRRDARKPSVHLTAILHDACSLAGVRRIPQIITTDAVRAPALFGIIRPAILLPHELEANGDAASLKLILLHELAHLQRRDLWAQIVASLIIALHWFNPIVWWAGRRMRAEAEMAADARALRSTDVTEAHRLGEVLLGFAHRATAGWLVWFATSTLLGISENKRDLKRRIEALSDIAKGRRTRWIVGLGIFMLLAVVGLTKAPAEDTKKEQTKEVVSKDTALTTTVECIVVDDQGKPVKGADVRLSINLPGKFESQDKKSGEDGRIRFDEAPKAAGMNMTARHPDYAESSMVVFKGYSESKEHRLVLPSISWVVGKVTDKRDGKPIKDARVFYGIENKFTFSSLFEWKFPTVRTNEAGEYRLPLKARDLKSIFVRAWAPDMTSHSRLLTITQRETAFDGALEPVKRIPGKVVNAEGQPLKDAFVWVVEDAVQLNETEKPITVEFLKSKSRSKLASGKMFISLDYSKEDGTFRLHDVDPLLKDRLWVVALHPEEGFTQMRARDLKPGAIFKLSRWASMTGKVIGADGKPLSEQTVSLYAKEEPTYIPFGDPTALKISHNIKFTTDKAGNYKIDRLLPGSNFSGVTTNKSYHSTNPVKVTSGPQKSQNITLNPSLRRGHAKGVVAVQGRIILPEGYSFRSDNYFMNLSISADELGIHEYPTPDADGRFMTESLPAGTYHLSLSIYARNSGMSLPRDAGRWMLFKIEPGSDKSLLVLDDIRVEKADLTLKPRTEANPETMQPPMYIDGPNGLIQVTTTDADKKPVPNVKLEVLDLVDHTQAPLGLKDVGRLVAAVTSDEMGKATLTFPRTVAADRRAYGVLVKGSTPDGAKSLEATLMDGQKTQLRVTPETPIDITVTPPIVTWSASGTGGMIAESQSVSDGRLKVRLPLVAGLSFNAFMLQGTTQNGEILFSKAILADKDIKQEIKTAVTLTRGVEINGKLEGLPESDDGTGWVLARVFVKAEAKMNQVSKGPHPMVSWTVWAPVNRDGSFHIAGIPHGMVSLSGLGKGWITVGGTAALFKIDNAQEKKSVTLGTKSCIEKAIRILLPDGSPVAGATVKVGILGTPNNLMLFDITRYTAQRADADKYARFEKEGWPGQKAVTDNAGRVTLLNQPHGQTYCQVYWIDPKTQRAHWETVKVQIDSKAEGPVDIKLTGKPSL